MKDFDFNFKLVIIENLLYNSKNKKPIFEEEYKEILETERYKNENYRIFKEMLYDEMCISLYEYIKNLEISDEDLSKIEKMYIDGGSQIYQDLAPSWNGESKIFDVTSIDGIEKLVNLKTINIFSLTTKEVDDKLKTLDLEVNF